MISLPGGGRGHYHQPASPTRNRFSQILEDSRCLSQRLLAVAAVAALFAVDDRVGRRVLGLLRHATPAKNGSKGIYRSKFDDATGKLSAPELAAEMGSPSFVNIHPNGKFLYAVGEGTARTAGRWSPSRSTPRPAS